MNTRPRTLLAIQNEGASGERPQEGLSACAEGGFGSEQAQDRQFVTVAGGATVSPVPDAMIISAFRIGLDSMDIARVFHVHESAVWNALARKTAT